MTAKPMEERCADHAMVAARHARMKSLNPAMSGIEFVAQGMMLIFEGIDQEVAHFLAKVSCSHACELLIARRVEEAKHEAALMLDQAAAEAMSRGPS